MNKFVKCTYCGKPIHLGETFVIPHYEEGIVFCDSDCFAESMGFYEEFTMETAERLYLEVFDEAEHINKLKSNIENARRELQLMELELADITGDYADYLSLLGVGNRKEMKTMGDSTKIF